MPEPGGRTARTLYTALLWMLAPIAGPVLLAYGLLRGKYLAVLPERLGWSRSRGVMPEGALWIHGVSV